MSTTAPSPSTPIKAVIIYGPHGCGKTRHAITLALFYKKSQVIDDWAPGMPLPADALALTNVDGIDGAIPFHAALKHTIKAPTDVKANSNFAYSTGSTDFIPAGEDRRFAVVDLDWMTFADISAHMSMTDAEVRRLIRSNGFPRPSRRRDDDHADWIKVWSAAEFHSWKKEWLEAAAPPVLFCKDCQHFNLITEQCAAPAALLMNLVWGPAPQPSKAVRAHGGKCGVAAALFMAQPTVDAPVAAEIKAERAPYERRAPAAIDLTSVRTITFATGHLILIEIALDSHIVLLEECVKAAPDSMAQRDALDIARQALELVQ